MCIATSAAAHQVQIGVEQGIDVDSNVLSSSIVRRTDGFYRLTPTVTLSQPVSDLQYRFDYRPTYSGYFETGGLNGWDHVLVGRGTYQLDARNALRFDTSFIRALAIRRNTFTDAAGQTQVVPTQIGTTQRFSANVALDHSLSARTTATLGMNYDRWDYSAPNNIDNQGYGARLDLTHAFLPRWVLGLGIDGRYRAFDEGQVSPASFSTVLNANVLARVELSQQMQLRVSGGPAGVFSRQSEPDPRLVNRWGALDSDPVFCPSGPCARLWGPDPNAATLCAQVRNPPGLTDCLLSPGAPAGVPGFPDEFVAVSVDPSAGLLDTSTEALTYFVSVALVRDFRRGSLRLSFVRNEDAGSGIGATTIANSGTAVFSYSLSDSWYLKLTGSYVVRESVGELPFTYVSARASSERFSPGGPFLAEASSLVPAFSNRRFQQDIGQAVFSLQRRLSEHTRLRFRFRYYRQSQDSVQQAGRRTFDRYTGGIFFDYEFDPYKL